MIVELIIDIQISKLKPIYELVIKVSYHKWTPY